MAYTDHFLLAVERARLSLPDGKWEALTVSQQSDAIYRELRLIDADVVAGRLAASRLSGTTRRGQTPRFNMGGRQGGP